MSAPTDSDIDYHTLTKSAALEIPGLKERLLELTMDHPKSGLREFLLLEPLPYEWVVLAIPPNQHVLGWAAIYGAMRSRVYADMFVDPAYRNQGIGRELCNGALELATTELVVSDVPFYRHVFPNAEPHERAGLKLLRITGGTNEVGH